MIKEGGIDLVVKLCKQHVNVLELLRALVFLVGKMAENKEAQDKFAEKEIILTFKKGVDLFPEDCILANNINLALANLCFCHKENTKQAVDCEILEHFKKQVELFLDEPTCMQNLASVLNNMGFKNKELKEWFGAHGFVQVALKIHEYYATDKFMPKTLKQSLKYAYLLHRSHIFTAIGRSVT